MNHTISDFIIRIKNASLAKRKETVLPYSRVCEAIGQVLVKEKILERIKTEEHGGRKVLVGTIRYERRLPVFTDMIPVSKPSLRVYISAMDIKARKLRGIKTTVLSTNLGIMTGEEAQRKGVGGELLFEVL